MKVMITRTPDGTFQMLGELQAPAFSCKTLELPWLDNKNEVSCIPPGKYVVKKRNSDKYGDHFHLQDVPNRTFILIHHGNFKKDIKGCILVGATHTDIDGNGFRDVTQSKDTMKKLNEILPAEFELEIK